MIMKLVWLVAPLLVVSACSGSKTAKDAYVSGDEMERATKNKAISYTFEDFIAEPGYRDSRDYWRGGSLSQYSPAQSYAEILQDEQRGRLSINGQIAMDFPVCSGRVGGKETPKGVFRITEKQREHRSSLYGAFVDDAGRFVKSASVGDKAPAGTRFEGSSMPYWLRFNGAIGLHVGAVHRQEASHGCVRVPEEAARILFAKLAVGSRVIVR